MKIERGGEEREQSCERVEWAGPPAVRLYRYVHVIISRVCLCALRCLHHLRMLVLVLFLCLLSSPPLPVSQVAVCADANEVLLSDGNEKSIQSILSSSSTLLLSSRISKSLRHFSASPSFLCIPPHLFNAHLCLFPFYCHFLYKLNCEIKSKTHIKAKEQQFHP